MADEPETVEVGLYLTNGKRLVRVEVVTAESIVVEDTMRYSLDYSGDRNYNVEEITHAVIAKDWRKVNWVEMETGEWMVEAA